MKTEFYKMEYESWDEGTDSLTLEQEGAYLRLCHQMYRRRGPIPNHLNTLARLWRCHPNKATALIKQLIAAGKIELTPDGHLTNTKVTQVLHDRGIISTQAAENGRKGGTQRAQNAAKQLELQGSDQADASSPSKPSQAIREERRVEKKISLV